MEDDNKPIHTLEDLKHLVCLNEVRSLPSVFNKIEALVRDHKVSISQACLAVGVKRRRYYRWLDARAKGRSPNKNGRPTSLTVEQEQTLIEKIKHEAKNQNAMTKTEIVQRVSLWLGVDWLGLLSAIWFKI